MYITTRSRVTGRPPPRGNIVIQMSVERSARFREIRTVRAGADYVQTVKVLRQTCQTLVVDRSSRQTARRPAGHQLLPPPAGGEYCWGPRDLDLDVWATPT